MIKRQSLKQVNKLLKQNSSWKILDLGCGDRPNHYATHVADVRDMSRKVNGKDFKLIIPDKALPYENKEFDFVICSHVIEHVKNINFFLNEIQRISKKGYIEVPSRLEDNLIFINKKDHIWWFKFDDDEQKLLYCKRKQFLEPVMSVNLGWKFRENFRESFVLELLWEDKIILEETVEFDEIKNNISRFEVLRKFCSFVTRTFLKLRY